MFYYTFPVLLYAIVFYKIKKTEPFFHVKTGLSIDYENEGILNPVKNHWMFFVAVPKGLYFIA